MKKIVIGALMLFSSFQFAFAEDMGELNINAYSDGSQTESSVGITIDQLDDYVDYKVYYSKEGDTNNMAEELFTMEDGLQSMNVTISGLDSETQYDFFVKAINFEGEPMSETSSDAISIRTLAPQHYAASSTDDNVIYDPSVTTSGTTITVKFRPGEDVKKINISISQDGNTYKPVATIEATETEYSFEAEVTGKNYVKLVPIDADGGLGICKIGTADTEFVVAEVEPEEEAQENTGKPDTGPELYFLVLIAIAGYAIYRTRKYRLN